MCPKLTTATALVSIGSGKVDNGAWHRAIIAVNKLIDAGRYDWRTQGAIRIDNPYGMDCYAVQELVENVHYTIGGYAPLTELEKEQQEAKDMDDVFTAFRAAVRSAINENL